MTVESFLINLNSMDATPLNGDYKSNVMFSFRNLIIVNPLVQQTTVSVINAQIPCSFYCVNYSNNSLSYLWNGSNFSLSITPGNYNANGLLLELQTQFLANGHFVTVSVNKKASSLIFTVVSTTTLTLVAISTASSVLGIGTTNIDSVAGVLPCPRSMNLLGITRLSIGSNALMCRGYSSTGGGANLGCLASFCVDSSSFGLLSYTMQNKFAPVLTTNHVDGFDIQITDQNGNLVNFRGIDWQICIQIDRTLYDVPLPNLTLANPEPIDDTQPVDDPPPIDDSEPIDDTQPVDDNSDDTIADFGADAGNIEDI